MTRANGQQPGRARGAPPPGDLREHPQVAVAAGIPGYADPPFHPAQAYPECPFCHTDPGNHAYAGVRRALALLGLDAQRHGRPDWNPLGRLVRPGDTVVLKPNFVRDFRETQPGHADCVTTHGAVIRAVCDYVYRALGGRGRIIIADAPQNDADFAGLRAITGLDALARYYREQGFGLEICDLRPERARKVNGVIVGHAPLRGDPAGYVRVNLGAHSHFAEIEDLCHRLYGSEYDTRELYAHQHGDVHEYLISRTVLAADVVISLPKLKTHKKVGLTVNLKNLVGINGNKNWLPHHRLGPRTAGGDEFADENLRRRVERLATAYFKRVFPRLGPLRPLLAAPLKRAGTRAFGDTNTDTVRSGNWYGNDTTWRMVLDLNRILYYADADGRLHDRPVRRIFSVVDGIVAGEGNGPLDPTPRATGLVLAGWNPVAVDLACARLAGFDYRRMPMLSRAFDDHALPLAHFEPADVTLCSDDVRLHGPCAAVHAPELALRPHFGWRGHVELRAAEAPA